MLCYTAGSEKSEPAFLFGDYMNVKISYTVPFERIPQKVAQVLHSTDINEIRDLLDSFYSCPETIGHSLQTIDSIRRKLGSLDLLLQDCYNILVSFDARAQGAVQQPQIVDIDQETEKDNNV